MLDFQELLLLLVSHICSACISLFPDMHFCIDSDATVYTLVPEYPFIDLYRAKN